MGWIILDVMGVIYEVGDDTNDLLVPFIRRRNMSISARRINDLYLEASLGKISSQQLWAKLGFQHQYPGIEGEYLNTYTLDPDLKRVVRMLGEEYQIEILSNDLSEWARFLRIENELDELFDVVVISAEVGFRKPDQEIYEIFLEKTGASADDCIFIDDRLRNLRPARKLGMKVEAVKGLFSRIPREDSWVSMR